MTKIKGLTIELNVEKTEALKEIKEVTEAANECVAALEKLERLTNKFSGLPSGGLISVGTVRARNFD